MFNEIFLACVKDPVFLLVLHIQRIVIILLFQLDVLMILIDSLMFLVKIVINVFAVIIAMKRFSVITLSIVKIHIIFLFVMIVNVV